MDRIIALRSDFCASNVVIFESDQNTVSGYAGLPKWLKLPYGIVHVSGRALSWQIACNRSKMCHMANK